MQWLCVSGVRLVMIVILLAPLAPGCAPANPLGRVAIAGKVTLDGQPVETGTIEFAPAAGGVGSGAKIVSGSYAIEEQKGLPPGKYLVRIYAPLLPPSAKPVEP